MEMNAVKQIIDTPIKEGRTVLTEVESKQILLHLGIPVPTFFLAKTEIEAMKYASMIGFPVVLKIVSPDIIHKSDAKGVVLNLQNEEEVKASFNNMIKNAKDYNPNAEIIGVSVQKMIKNGTEVIIGMNRDEVFGPVILFGLGGIFVELFKDVSLKVLPVTEKDIENMFTEINGSKVLYGFRGSKPVDLESIKKMIMRVVEFTRTFPEVTEFELNPVLIHEEGKGSVALDARIILQKQFKEVRE